MTAHSLQSLVDEGFAPSVRWLANGIKANRIPGRMIGRYWGNWLMTDADLEMFLDGARPAATDSETPAAADAEPDLIISGLSARTARRLKRVS